MRYPFTCTCPDLRTIDVFEAKPADIYISRLYPPSINIKSRLFFKWSRRGRDRIAIGFITTCMQSVPIITKVVSSNSAHGEVYSMQHYVYKVC
jgi:hypothetical protein